MPDEHPQHEPCAERFDLVLRGDALAGIAQALPTDKEQEVRLQVPPRPHKRREFVATSILVEEGTLKLKGAWF